MWVMTSLGRAPPILETIFCGALPRRRYAEVHGPMRVNRPRNSKDFGVRYPSAPVLLVSQGLDGIEAGGFEGWEKSGKDSDGGAERDSHEHRAGRDDRCVGSRADQLQN